MALSDQELTKKILNTPLPKDRKELVQNLRALLSAAGDEDEGGGATLQGDVAIRRSGEEILLPEGMAIPEAIAWLQRKHEADDQLVTVQEVIEGYPFDAAHAFSLALKQKYGWTGMETQRGFFGDTPPRFVTVPISPTETIQVPWGEMKIPGIEGTLNCDMTVKDGARAFVLIGSIKARHRDTFKEVADLTRQMLREKSIYRGKAIHVAFPEEGEESGVMDMPKFLDLSETHEAELVFPREIEQMLQTTLFTPIEHTEECRKARVPLKRGVLLAGDYGTGKTLTGNVTALKCQRHGWTFIYIETVKDLSQGIEFARRYQPAVVFAEDIDQVLRGEDRDDAMNGILNTIDGMNTKNAEIVVVLTTNEVDRIHKAMIRPGRIDTVVPVQPPDPNAVQRLMRIYGRDLIAKDADLGPTSKMLAGRIPAVIREVVERAKLAAVHRTAQEGTSDTFELTSDDLLRAAREMTLHLKLMDTRQQAAPTALDDFATKFGREVGEAIRNGITNGVIEESVERSPDTIAGPSSDARQ